MMQDKELNSLIQESRLLETVLELVQLDSESRNERAVADYVKQKLKTLGYVVKEDDADTYTGGNAGM